MQPHGEVILPVITLSSEAWSNPVCLVRDYKSHVITTKDGKVITALPSGLDVALPKRDASGAQNLTFALDGVRLEATRLLRESESQGLPIHLEYAEYLLSDLSEPASDVYYFIVRSFTAQADHVEITAGLFDLIDMRFPRWHYDSETAPCLEFMQ